MDATIQRAADLIRERIHEIDADKKQLEASLAALTGKSATKKRGPDRPRASNNGRKNAPRGQRREQLLAHLEQNPGARPSQIAKALGVSPNQVSGLLRKGREDKLVRKVRGGGYRLTAR